MINVTRLNPRLENTAFIYLIDRGGTFVPPNEAIAALNQLDDQEITLTLGHVVVIKAEGKLGSGDRSGFYVHSLVTDAFFYCVTAVILFPYLHALIWGKGY